MRKILLCRAIGLGLAVLVFVAIFVTKSTTTRGEVPSIFIQPTVIYPGDPVFITVNATSTPVAILWDKNQRQLFQYEGKTRAFMPIDFGEKKLEHVVTVRLANGQTLTNAVHITPRIIIEKPLGIPEKLGGNTPAAATNLVRNLSAENKILNTVRTSPTILWTKPFQYPLANVVVTDPYGYDRKTVGESIVHKGTDFHASIGTEVRAMNAGVVRIARAFSVYGNTVVIDHGLGVQTLYMHMSALDVHEGQTVERGTVLGKSGDTGYADAAHLHISVKIDAVSIDPMTFMGFFPEKPSIK